MEHSGGLWVVNDKHPARSSDGDVVIEQKGGSDPIAICPRVHDGKQQENARRIVVSVNLLRGYSTEELEQRGIVSLVGDELLKQDALLKGIKKRIHDWSSMSPADMKTALSDIEDEIAAAKLLGGR